MKRVITLIVISLFLIGFISAAGITASAIENEDNDSEDDNNGQHQNTQNKGDDSQIQTQNRLTDDQIRSITTTRNRIQNQSECPNNCTCTGSVTTCQLQNQRRMTITAGKSGNVIVQVKGVNASTDVTLYKSDNKIYGIFKNNETKEVKVFPDEVRDKIRERITERLENQTIELDEDGIYQIQAKKRARLFALFPVRATIRAEVNSETGEVLRIRKPWWNFLAQDETEE